MKKWSLLLLVLFMAVSTFLAGCSSDSSNSGQSSKGADGATKLTLWTFGEQHAKFFEFMADEWNKTHPDKKIQLETTTYPYDDMHNKLLLSLQSGVGAPDIVDIEISRFSNYLKGKPQLVELNDIIDPVKDKAIQSRFDIYSKDGKYYGIDFHVGATVIYYNKELLDKAGVNPDEIVTWDDFREAGKKVVSATGKPMMTIETDGPWTYWPLVVQQGSDFYDKDGKVILDNDINIKTLTFLKQLLDEKIAIAAPGGNHHAEEYYGFMNKGGAASVVMPMWYMVRFTDYMPDLKGKIIIKPMPKWTADGKRSAGMGGTGTAITNQCKNVELAKEFLAFAKLSKEANIQIWKQLGFDPIRWDVWSDPALKEPNKYTEYFGDYIFDVLMSVKDEINSPTVTENTPKMNELVVQTVLYKVLKEKSMSPEQALKKVADEMRKQ
ncbi:sugar ABC transporter substrate-binding protein [Geobacillus subterraneus]|uniref:ABC transporter substrate-binding protein n=1 Tax=Geobacillus subterraneus TaxID=129338 RepID=UPI002AC934BC|nr:sugar ABC transporter substrate-binding protein [Geobacillus subterraneus]WPZ16923.1 sugar ABC transporter substrate-binding protein [Geobacillus subterraneus]